MLRKRYYILFVARDEDGRVRKIPLPLHYAYGFVAAALVGAFTIVGLAGSYTRMLLKTESFNQVRQERENLRKDYKQMAQIAHDRDVQVASLGALANEVTALYGLKQSRLAAANQGGGGRGGRADADQPGHDRRSEPAAGEALDRRIVYAADAGALRPRFARAGGRPDALVCRRLDGTGRCAFDMADRRPRGSSFGERRIRSTVKANSTPASISKRRRERRCAPRRTAK